MNETLQTILVYGAVAVAAGYALYRAAVQFFRSDEAPVCSKCAEAAPEKTAGRSRGLAKILPKVDDRPTFKSPQL